MIKVAFLNSSDVSFEWGRLLIPRLSVIANNSSKTEAHVYYGELR